VGSGGEREVALDDFYRLPGDEPQRDTTLQHGELVTAVTVPPLPTGARSTYTKVRDRASYAFALVSVAAALVLDGDTVEDVRVAWGGVAHKPWRARTFEERLRGQTLTAENVDAALDAELADASTDADTAYKVPMVRRATAMTLARLAHDGPDQEGPA
jgi:xanthine dehydrogenase YagS FAD-binding subunit